MDMEVSKMIIKAFAALRNDYSSISDMAKETKALQAELERLSGAETLSVTEARKRLRDRIDAL